MKLHLKFTLFALAGLFLLGLASGCKNTANGAGRDIEKIGEKIQDKTN